jgi:hypothetical protein
VMGDEARVVEQFSAWLQAEGWTVEHEVDYCDVSARRREDRLFAEAKGRTSSPGHGVS